MTDPAPIQPLPPRTAWAAAVLIAAAFFVATAPTLAWLEFSGSMENLVVATALQTRQYHQWLIPTLEGEPRTAKPPLTTWIAAAAIRPSTLRALDSPDDRVRFAGYRALAWDVRWPALLCSCLMLLAVFDLAKTLAGGAEAGASFGLLAMTVCGSSIYLLRFGRQITTDVELALWVTVASAALARLVLRGRSWPAALTLGASLGLALMSKGPVALLQTIVPAAVFVFWRGRPRPRLSLGQLAAAVLLMIVIGGTWYAVVASRDPGVWGRWRAELTRSDATFKTNNPFSYLTLFSSMLPWTAVLIHGLIWTIVEAWRARRHQRLLPAHATGMVLAMFLLVVPVVIMSCVRDRQDRYLLPLVGPASVLAARGLLAMLDSDIRGGVPPWVQWAILFIISIGLPVAGATVLKRADGRPWYRPEMAMIVVALMMCVVAAAHQLSLRRPVALVIGSAVVMLLLQPVFYLGYRDTRQGRSEMRPLAEMIRTVAPTAEMYYWRPRGRMRGDVALSIYLNRPTIWIGDAAALPPSHDRPQVIIADQRPKASPPQPPAGWLYLAKVPRDEDWFWAFVRLPEDAAKAP